MYTSKINIKHHRHPEIHWGVHKETGKMVWIGDVEANGFGCNCKCACCGTDLKACTQGKKRKPHFKHRANNGCYYGDEIAEYLKAREMLASLTTIHLPPVGLQIGKRGEVIIPSSKVCINHVLCHHDANHYPPLLTAEIGGQATRIILAFDGYYDHHDFTEFAAEVKNNLWNCLAVSLPHLDDDYFITADDLSNYIGGINRNKYWIFHTSAEKARTQFRQNASAPARLQINYGETVYACPLHKREHGRTFYAREQDCANCEFNLELSPVCLCMAKAYVKSLADLETPIEERTKKFLAHRKANEDALAKQRSVKKTAPRPSNGQYPQQQQQTQQFHEKATGGKQNLPVDALCDEYRTPSRRKKCNTQQILRENYEQEDYIIFDSAGHQWMKCVRCGWPVTKKEVTKHITCNKGICTECLARESDEM